jgi:penicillin-binding protein activator
LPKESEKNMKKALFSICCAAGVASVVLTTGCSAFRGRVSESDVNKPVRMSADYDYEDLRTMGKAVGESIMGSEFLKAMKAQPVFVTMGVQNRTNEHIDTKALTDTVRATMFEAGKVSFVNEARRDDLLKEQGYQAANATPESRAAIGKQLGANYMLSGSLVEIKKKSMKQVRVSSQEEIYFQLTMEITDLETGLIVWQKQFERARTASKPLIGW